MTYNPNYPAVTSTPAIDVTQIQTNFSQYNSAFSQTSGGIVYNHMPMNDPNQGKHGAIILQSQATISEITNNYDQLFAMPDVASQNQVFVQVPKFLPNAQNPINADNTPMQITYNTVNTTGPDYQSFMVGRNLIFFGNATLPATITLSPTPTQILYCSAYGTATTLSNSVAASISYLITQPNQIILLALNLPPATPIYWMAIASI